MFWVDFDPIFKTLAEAKVKFELVVSRTPQMESGPKEDIKKVKIWKR